MHCPSLLHQYVQNCSLHSNLVKVADSVCHNDTYMYVQILTGDTEQSLYQKDYELNMTCKGNCLFSQTPLVRGIPARVDFALENSFNQRCRKLLTGHINQYSPSCKCCDWQCLHANTTADSLLSWLSHFAAWQYGVPCWIRCLVVTIIATEKSFWRWRAEGLISLLQSQPTKTSYRNDRF